MKFSDIVAKSPEKRIADALERIANALELLIPPLPVEKEPIMSDLPDLSVVTPDEQAEIEKGVAEWCKANLVMPNSPAYERLKEIAEDQIIRELGEEGLKYLPWNRKS